MFSPHELLELLLLIGYFRLMNGLMTALDVELEPPFGVKILALAGGSASSFCHCSLNEPRNASLVIEFARALRLTR